MSINYKPQFFLVKNSNHKISISSNTCSSQKPHITHFLQFPHSIPKFVVFLFNYKFYRILFLSLQNTNLPTRSSTKPKLQTHEHTLCLRSLEHNTDTNFGVKCLLSDYTYVVSTASNQTTHSFALLSPSSRNHHRYYWEKSEW